MSLTSSIFLFIFFPLAIILYIILPGLKQKNCLLLVLSLIFYAFSGIQFAIVLIVLVLINYIIGFAIGNQSGKKRSGFFLAIGLCINFGVLFLYKYLPFAASNINALFQWNLPQQQSLMMPLGLSFAVFKLGTYLIDLYRGKIAFQPHFHYLLLYSMLFPTVISGPIVTYSDIAPQFEGREIQFAQIYHGIKRFVFGFSKKILVASTLGEVADHAFGGGAAASCAVAWLGILCYSLQLYYDFSGYSDMALGISEMLGFHFKENFNYPYISKSIQEFWRRWHISLSSWFRDYLYIPLGGNRTGAFRTYRNLLIVFIATGLWHGANWTFIFWGLFHGFFIVIEKAGFQKILEKLPRWMQHFYTIMLILIGWTIFRSDSLNDALQYISHLFSFSALNPAQVLFWVDRYRLFILITAILFSAPVYPLMKSKLSKQQIQRHPAAAHAIAILSDFFAIILLIFTISCTIAGDFQPFIYGKF